MEPNTEKIRAAFHADHPELAAWKPGTDSRTEVDYAIAFLDWTERKEIGNHRTRKQVKQLVARACARATGTNN